MVVLAVAFTSCTSGTTTEEVATTDSTCVDSCVAVTPTVAVAVDTLATDTIK